MQFEPIAREYGAFEAGYDYELRSNWPSVLGLLPSSPATVLDYGSGNGTYASILSRAGYEVTATDISPAMIGQLQDESVRKLAWSYHDGSLPEKFEVIVAKLVVHFVEDLSKFAQVMRGQLDTAGKLIISVPHPDYSRPLVRAGESTYHRSIGTSALLATMIHRERAEYIDTLKEAGLRLVKSDEPLNVDALTNPPKRLNMLFEPIR
ncbi:MAG: class I SAM-dependent methyltransferase [Candidatus Saccharibacteria bacterium]